MDPSVVILTGGVSLLATWLWVVPFDFAGLDRFMDWRRGRLKRKQQRDEPEIQQREVFADLTATKARMRLEAKTSWLLSYEELLSGLPVSSNPLLRHWEGRQLLAVQREIHTVVDWNLRERDRERERIRERYAHYGDPVWGPPGHRGW